MAQPVWVLSVDLQAKTATFQSGLASAARSARGSFQEIRDASQEMGVGVVSSHSSVRASIGLLDNTIRGAHGAAMADLIRMFAQTSAGMAAMPFLPVIGLIALFIGTVVGAVRALQEWREEQQRLGTAQSAFHASLNEAMNGLTEKLLQAGIRADDLHNNHLGALAKQLQLIDLQTMGDLIRELEQVARASDTMFEQLKSHWYEFSGGSEGAKKALDTFKAKYDEMVSSGDTQGASGFLQSTIKRNQQLLQAMKDAQHGEAGGGWSDDNDPAKYYAAIALLKQAKAGGHSEKEIQSQQTLVEALQAQLSAEQKLQELRSQNGNNAKTEVGNEAAQRRAEAERQTAASMGRMGEIYIRSDRATADARLEIANATAEERLASDLDFAQREHDVKEAENAAQIAALDKSGKDYNNQLAALRQRSLEIDAEYSANVSEMRAKTSVEVARRDTETLQQGIREQIEATQQGSAARLAAIERGISAEEAKQLQNTQFYRELLQQRVETQRKMGEEAAKLAEEGAKQQASADQKLGELEVAALKEHYALVDSATRVGEQERMTQALNAANLEYDVKMRALQAQVTALDKSGREYNNKLRQLQNEETQLTRQHEDEITKIKEQAEIERNNRITAAESRFQQTIASSLTQSIMGHQSWAKTLDQIGNQVVSGMIQNALMSMMAEDMTKEKDAASAARKAFNAGMHFPFPVNLVMAPVLGAAAFASVMAFNEGGIVPGVGRGDIVPAMLEPGEGVVPKGVMEGLSNVAKSGGFGSSGQTIHVHVRPTYHVNTIDGDGMRSALEKHSDALTGHFHNVVRRMNK